MKLTFLTIAVSLTALMGLSAQETKKSPEKPKSTGITEEEFAKLHELKGDKAPPLAGEMVELAKGKAYLSLPKATGAPMPAVIVIHEWWGLNEHIKHWADRLAQDGYAAIAVDLYGGKVAAEPREAQELMRGVDEVEAKRTIRAAHDFLTEDKRIKADKTASIGWCFGGGWSLKAALAIPELDVAVIYYGHLVTDAKALGAVKAEILGVFGTQDRSIPQTVVDDFEKGLTEAKVKHEISRYDAPHAFANPSSARYDDDAAAKAWKKVRKLFKRVLKGEEDAGPATSQPTPKEGEPTSRPEKKPPMSLRAGSRRG